MFGVGFKILFFFFLIKDLFIYLERRAGVGGRGRGKGRILKENRAEHRAQMQGSIPGCQDYELSGTQESVQVPPRFFLTYFQVILVQLVYRLHFEEQEESTGWTLAI